MKLLVFYRKNSDHSQIIEEFLINLRDGRGFDDIEEIDIDKPEAQLKLQLRDIVDKPVLMAEAEDGNITKIWQGSMLPTINEVVSYLVGRG